MDNKGVRNLFIYGSLFFFVIFLYLTYDTMGKLDKRAPEITENVNQGKMVWHKYDCIGCHTILGNGSYFAPDMTKVVENKPKAYLKQFIMDPKSVNPNASMPKLGISSEEADNLITFLEWISKVDTNGWPPKPILAVAGTGQKEQAAGQRLFLSMGCQGCHMVNSIGGTSGPDLTHIGSKKDRAFVFSFLKDPQAVKKGSAMPPVKASDADIEALTDYLVTLK
ncbi:MAG: cytochrome c [Thermodesulfovibrionales bacterium]|nr:cytochrome c [Thermodesulfovibrionales bacterium]